MTYHPVEIGFIIEYYTEGLSDGLKFIHCYNRASQLKSAGIGDWLPLSILAVL